MSDKSSENVETPALIDCGAGGQFIDQNYARKFTIRKLDKPLMAYNVDGTENKRGKITSFVDLSMTINGRTMDTRLLVTGLGKQKVILGFPWLAQENPDINWTTGEFKWRGSVTRRLFGPNLRNATLRRLSMLPNKEDNRNDSLTGPVNVTPESAGGDLSSIKSPKNSEKEARDDEEQNETRYPSMEHETDLVLSFIDNQSVWINSKTSNSIEFHLTHDEKKDDLPLDQLIPVKYHEYLDVFDDKKADRFPESRTWDHKIELKEGFPPKSFKSYNMTPAEQTEMDKFLKENLAKGYIRPSQSPMASPMFFVKKKDGGLRPCQDYRYLNDWTIKNAYPLPLISELMDKIKDAKYFTKLDVRWGYNNVRIKDGDQWKAAFKTNKGLFEPTVMFF